MAPNKFYEGYEKLKTVGQGAFGTATLYRRLNDGKHVVIKEIYTVDLDNSEKKSALNEVEILANLNHPNIIRYLGSFQNEGSLVIIMEYADGGNLAQLISAKRNKNENFREQSLLNIISQISSAISYMHSNKILHRDLKTANIFLSMSGAVKVGDFGISKVLNTRSQAQTVVGTPYYLSPEMCEGSDYNEKSDVWAIGCILYELASLRKPFEAPTLPVLVKKIIACEYDPIPDIYSGGLSELVESILQLDTELRPTAKFMHEQAVPKMLKWAPGNPVKSDLQQSTADIAERSVLYRICDFGEEQRIDPVQLPHKKVVDFSIGPTHCIAVTSDHTVYTWGENILGQLATKEMTQQKIYPSCASLLNGKQIVKCAAGKCFSIFLSEEGTLFSCGDGSRGCLGHGDWNSLNEPTRIASLANIKINEISCGHEHVAALSQDGRVFTWGSSKSGQLGQGHSQFRCHPLAINILNAKIKAVFCGGDCTFLLTSAGQVLASGGNNCGKLGIPHKETVTLFTQLRNLKEKVAAVASGKNHTVMLTVNGNIIGIGSNSEAQLGVGNTLSYSEPQFRRLGMKVTAITCGNYFSVAAEDKNVLWLWGSPNSSSDVSSANTFRKFAKGGSSTIPFKKFSDEPGKNPSRDEATQCIKKPQSILALHASASNRKNGNLIQLRAIQANSNSLFVLVESTAAPPVKQFTSSDLHSSNFVMVKLFESRCNVTHTCVALIAEKRMNEGSPRYKHNYILAEQEGLIGDQRMIDRRSKDD